MMDGNDKVVKNVVIVGGGMAGLTAARKLNDELSSFHAIVTTVVEASDTLGGRIRGDTTFVPGHVLDVGAEYIHGKETMLTDLVNEYSQTKWKRNVTHASFITAHADGGPYPPSGVTEDGYYGRYYMNKELMAGNDKRLQPLHDVLASLDDEPCDETTTSIGDVLEKRILPANPSLHDMAVAGYANTVGCTDLSKVSLAMINRFEAHWQENEVEGDLHMDSTIGIYGIVDALSQKLRVRDNFECKLSWNVVEIQQTDDGVRVVSSLGEEITADAIIVTVPPPMLTKLGFQLSEKKMQALKYVGYDTALKFILKFSKRLWPSHLESVICASCDVPEMWFREYKQDCFTATCFLTSDCARNFLKCISNEEDGNKPCLEKAETLVMDQLSEMLRVPKSDLVDAHLDSLLFDWSNHPFIQGGYMYPKVGMTQEHLCDLAEPEGNVFFAGEATNTNACCTIQAAMETGERAAKQVQEYLGS